MSISALCCLMLVSGVAGPATAVAPTAAPERASTSAPDVSNVSTSDVSTLRAELRAGGLAADHSTVALCRPLRRGCATRAVTATGSSSTQLATDQPVGYTPSDIARAYHLPAPASGQVGTVAFVGDGADPSLVADIAAYRAQFGLPGCADPVTCVRQVSFNGGPAMTSTDDPDLRNRQDVEAEVSAAQADAILIGCPRCSILDVELPLLDDSFVPSDFRMVHDRARAVDTAIRLGADAVIVNNSGVTRSSAESAADSAKLYHPGVPIVTDADFGAGFSGTPAMAWPSNLPWVTAVGYTSLFADDPAATTFHQVADVVSGGGCDFGQPGAVGQPHGITKLCGGHRATADIAAVGDAYTGIAAYTGADPAEGFDSWFTIGGLTAPALIAALYVRGGHTSQVIGPNTLYAASASSFLDVTLGDTEAAPHVCSNNHIPQRLCQAGVGWDGPTGLGSPNGLSAF